jgi:hypothetical protein
VLPRISRLLAVSNLGNPTGGRRSLWRTCGFGEGRDKTCSPFSTEPTTSRPTWPRRTLLNPALTPAWSSTMRSLTDALNKSPIEEIIFTSLPSAVRPVSPILLDPEATGNRQDHRVTNIGGCRRPLSTLLTRSEPHRLLVRRGLTPALVLFQVVHGVIQVGNSPAIAPTKRSWWVADTAQSEQQPDF